MKNAVTTRMPECALYTYIKDDTHFASQIYLFPTAGVILVVADPDAIKDLSLRRTTFPKPLELYEGSAIFGNNIIVSEGEEWRKYHRIAAPAFSEVCAAQMSSSCIIRR